VHDPHASIARRILDRVEETASDNPLLSIAGAMGVHGAYKKFAEYAEKLGSTVLTDGIASPDIDIDDVVEKIGSVVLQ
jgi:hypothetical protein